MRLFYRLVILNLAVISAIAVLRKHHWLMKFPVVPNPIVLFAGVILLVANYAITSKVVRQGGIPSLESSRWWSAGFAAWTGGPFFTAVLPWTIAGWVIKRDFVSFLWVTNYFFWSCFSWAQIYNSLRRPD